MSLSVSQCQRPNAAASGSVVLHIAFSFSTLPTLLDSVILPLCSLVTVWSSHLFFHLNLPPAFIFLAPSSLHVPCVCALGRARLWRVRVFLRRTDSWRGVAGWKDETNVALPCHPLSPLTSLSFCCHISHSSSSPLYFQFHLACISPSLSLPVASENDG